MRKGVFSHLQVLLGEGEATDVEQQAELAVEHAAVQLSVERDDVVETASHLPPTANTCHVTAIFAPHILIVIG